MNLVPALPVTLSLILVVSYYVRAQATGNSTDSTQNQLPEFAHKLEGADTPVLALSTGVSVKNNDALSTINTRLPYNTYFMEVISEFARERIPERVVHAKGYGAFGYFKVTHDLSDICTAKVFDTVGKTTKVLARFSPTNQQIGGRDTVRDIRGLGIKFYTEEGNLDLTCIHTEMFAIKDGLFFPPFVRALHRNPKTYVTDNNMFWDFLTLRSESLHMFMRILGDRGIPNGYRHMPAFPIHAFELLNKQGNRTYVKFQFLPDAGIQNLTTQQAATIQATDLDFAERDLYNAIHDGNYPSWTLYVQIIPFSERNNAGFDIFDTTKVWPIKQFPLREVGKLVLDKLPDNQFASVELAAFNPANLVNGIRGVDSLFEARVIAYRTTQNYRLGSNYNKIDVNCPLASAHTYNRDGKPPVGDNGGEGPNFFPNSFHGPLPEPDNTPPRLQVNTDPNPTNYGQAGELYAEMSDGEKCRLVENILRNLTPVKKELQERTIGLYKLIHEDLGNRILFGLNNPSQVQACPQL